LDEIELNIGPKDHFQLLELSETVAKFCANGISFLVGRGVEQFDDNIKDHSDQSLREIF
jgi:hypothetical protein